MRVVDRTRVILDIFAAARAQRRGQAPGRARAARVQPAAHARHVEAPRAARRRRRHARPGRVAARDRPPARARPRRAAASAWLGCERAARDACASGASARSLPAVALAGYTNVGKSTLLNALTGSDGLVRRPPLRDARPDDALLRPPRAHLRRDRHGRASSASCRTAWSRPSPRRSRRRSRATSSCTSCDASADEDELAAQIAAVESRARRDRRRRAAAPARAEQDRPLRRGDAAPPAKPPRRTPCRSRPRRARGSTT